MLTGRCVYVCRAHYLHLGHGVAAHRLLQAAARQHNTQQVQAEREGSTDGEGGARPQWAANMGAAIPFDLGQDRRDSERVRHCFSLCTLSLLIYFATYVTLCTEEQSAAWPSRTDSASSWAQLNQETLIGTYAICMLWYVGGITGHA